MRDPGRHQKYKLLVALSELGGQRRARSGRLMYSSATDAV